jgi:hypothetical protein
MFLPVSGCVEMIGWLGPGTLRKSVSSDIPGRSFIAVSMMFACLIVMPETRFFISSESASYAA